MTTQSPIESTDRLDTATLRYRKIPDIKTFLDYEIRAASRWIDRISNNRLQNLVASCFARKTKRKYRRYIESLQNRLRVVLMGALLDTREHKEIEEDVRRAAFDRGDFSLRYEIAERVLGWRKVSRSEINTPMRLEPHGLESGAIFWIDPSGEVRACSLCDDMPEFDSDDGAIREVEARICALGLRVNYIRALDLLLNQARLLGNVASYWNIATATASQKCLAAWQAVYNDDKK